MEMNEIQERYNAMVEQMQDEVDKKEQKRIACLEELGRPDISMQEYICKRTGKTYIPPEELSKLPMEEYIKARNALQT